MWWVQYALLFAAASALAAGAFLNKARAISALIGTFAWLLVGTASTAVVVWDGAGARHVVTSTSLAWLSYGVAAVHAFVFIAELREELTDDDTDPDSPDDLAARFNGLQSQDSISPLLTGDGGGGDD